jgi:hypothetical protein
MSTYGFGRVETDGFLGMIAVLREGAWGNIALPSATAPRPVWNLLSQEVRAKVRLSEALDVLRQAVASEDQTVELDQTWDRLQRRLDGLLTADTYHDDAERRAAALRLRKLLTLGNGTGQTGLSFEAEVDFGLRQTTLAAHECAADVALLGYGSVLAAIAGATQALREALGRAGGVGRTVRSQRVRDALAQCGAAFNLTLAELEEGLSRLPEGDDRSRYEALRAPLRALLERTPVTTAAPPPVASPEG